jgi:protein-S-isoprenylcysteine O-methyltransferase Ste14
MNWQHVRAIAALPLMVTVIIPCAILYQTGTGNSGWSLQFPLNLAAIFLGALLVVLGLALMFQTISLFATVGKGTLAPWDPTQQLVVRGVYRYVRNPMISGVLAILLGEASILGSPPIFCWFGLFLVVNMTYMPLVEEPGLERRFGAAYLRYKKSVPRWIPRLSPWEMPDRDG